MKIITKRELPKNIVRLHCPYCRSYLEESKDTLLKNSHLYCSRVYYTFTCPVCNLEAIVDEGDCEVVKEVKETSDDVIHGSIEVGSFNKNNIESFFEELYRELKTFRIGSSDVVMLCDGPNTISSSYKFIGIRRDVTAYDWAALTTKHMVNVSVYDSDKNWFICRV